VGIAGSAYGHCTATGHVQGNILLDFPEDDPLVLVGRMCLAVTITLAFPMLTIPARDILIRSLPSRRCREVVASEPPHISSNTAPMPLTVSSSLVTGNNDSDDALREPLLEVEHHDIEDHHLASGIAHDGDAGAADEDADGEEIDSATASAAANASFCLRLAAAVFVFWTAVAVACCVASIDVVWDLLGSSLSILLSYLIPCGSYLVIARKFGEEAGGGPHDLSDRRLSKAISWLLIVAFVPLMILSTANAVYDTFLHE